MTKDDVYFDMFNSLKESLIDKITQIPNSQRIKRKEFRFLGSCTTVWWLFMKLIHYARTMFDSTVLIHCPRTRKLTNNASLLRKNPSTIARVNVLPQR